MVNAQWSAHRCRRWFSDVRFYTGRPCAIAASPLKTLRSSSPLVKTSSGPGTAGEAALMCVPSKKLDSSTTPERLGVQRQGDQPTMGVFSSIRRCPLGGRLSPSMPAEPCAAHAARATRRAHRPPGNERDHEAHHLGVPHEAKD